MLIWAKEHSDPDGHWHAGIVLLPNGKRVGPLDVRKLEKTEDPPDED